MCFFFRVGPFKKKRKTKIESHLSSSYELDPCATATGAALCALHVNNLCSIIPPFPPSPVETDARKLGIGGKDVTIPV